MSSLRLAAALLLGVVLAGTGCSSSSSSDEPALKGPAPKVIEGDPNMKAPEDRGGGKGGPSEGQG